MSQEILSDLTKKNMKKLTKTHNQKQRVFDV